MTCSARRRERVLNRLSVFSGGFTFEAAVAVVADETVDEAKVSDCVWELRSKSMIAAQWTGAAAAACSTPPAPLPPDGWPRATSRGSFRRRHALYFSDLFRQGASMDVSGWPKALAVEVDNLRAAMNWAFSVEGDAKIGVDLAAASASSWMGMGLLTECQDWMTKAVGHLKGINSGTRQEMVIHSALASCMTFTGGMTEESYATWTKTRLLAEGLGDIEHQLVSLLVLWAHKIRLPRYAEAIELAERCGEVAQKIGDRGAIAMANYMRGISYHHTGRLLQAENCLEMSLHRDDEASRQALIKRFGYDRKVDALMILSSVVWLRGSPDHARRLNQMSLAEARQLGHAVPLCVTLAGVSFNAYRAGRDDEEAEALANELVDYAGKYGVASYHGFGLAMQALVRIRRGDAEAAAELLYAGLEKLSAVRYSVFHPIFQAEFARCLAVAGRAPQAIAVFERAKINLDDENQLFAPELLRIRGELALRNNEGLAVCTGYFLRAIEMSDRQGSVSWMLRAATSLAIAEKSARAKGGRLADLASHLCEISGRPGDHRPAVGRAGVERLIPARQRDQFDTLTACCSERFRLTLDGLGSVFAQDRRRTGQRRHRRRGLAE